MCISAAQARTKFALWGFHDLGPRLFSFFAYNCSMCMSIDMSMCMSIAHARAKSALRRSQALGLRHFHCKFSRKRALVGIVLKPLRRGPLIILCKSLREDLVEILGVPA